MGTVNEGQGTNGNGAQELAHIEWREPELRSPTEWWLVFDETENSPQYVSGTTNCLDKQEEGIITLVDEEGNGGRIWRENADGNLLEKYVRLHRPGQEK